MNKQQLDKCTVLVERAIRRLERRGCAISEADKDDLRQDGLIGALEAYGQWDPTKASLGTWLTSRIRSRLLDSLRNNASQELPYPQDSADEHAEPDPEAAGGDGWEPADPDMPDPTATQGAVLASLDGLRRNLDPESLQLLTMAYGLHGNLQLTLREIAARVGQSRAHVNRKINSALALSRQVLDK